MLRSSRILPRSRSETGRPVSKTVHLEARLPFRSLHSSDSSPPLVLPGESCPFSLPNSQPPPSLLLRRDPTLLYPLLRFRCPTGLSFSVRSVEVRRYCRKEGAFNFPEAILPSSLATQKPRSSSGQRAIVGFQRNMLSPELPPSRPR